MTICVREINPLPSLAVDTVENRPWLAGKLYEMLGDHEITCSVRIGTVNLTLQTLQSLQSGEILNLSEPFDAPVDILLDGKRIAGGELVMCDDALGILVTGVGP